MNLESEYRGPERRRAPRSITAFTGEFSVASADGVAFPFDNRGLATLVRSALDEDGAHNDITTIACVLSHRHARGTLVAREAGVVCGVPLALESFRQLDAKISIRVDAEDGVRVEAGAPVFFITGHARAMLSAERVALNYMQRLSGIATLTRQFVDAVRGTKAQILDTRKTTPGWRKLEKYAVRAGGGTNHRMDLAAAVLIKDNHLAAVDHDVGFAVRHARALAPEGSKVEVECDRPAQVQAALDAGADVIMLDNMRPAMLADCVRMVGGRAITEASGGVRLETVREIAETGVDWISVGALTHSAKALDLALHFE